MEKRKLRKYIFLGGVLFLFPLVWVIFFGVMGTHHFSTLPYFDETHLEGDTVPCLHVAQFDRLKNEFGIPYASDSLKGKVWLACFYSLNDPYIAKITERLLNINFKYRDEPDIQIVVFSTDSSSISNQVAQDYLNSLTKYNGFSGKWKFLSNLDSVQQVNKIMKESFFIHDISSEARFRLVDTKGHVRGLYGNTEYHMQSIIEDIALLKKEVDVARYNERHKND